MKIFFFLGCVIFLALYFGFAFSDIIYLKNGSSLEGKVVEQDKKSVTVELSNGTMVIKRSDILEIVKAEIKKEDEEKPEPKEEIPKEPSKVTAPSVDKSAKPVTTNRDAPLILSDEGKKPPQKEINNLLRKLVSLKESDNAWEVAEKLVVKSKDETAYLLELLGTVQNRDGLKWIIYTVGQLQVKESMKIFYEMLKTEADESVRVALVEALSQIKGVSTVDLFRRQLSVEKSNITKIAIINMLAKAMDVESLPVLLGMLDAEDDALSHTASLAIMSIYRSAKPQEIEDMDFMTMLNKTINNSGLKGKREILGILGQIKSKDTVDLMVKFLDDENADVRSAAVIAIAALRDNNTLEILVNRLNYEKDLWTRMQIIQSMGRTNNQTMIPVLIELLTDPEEKIRLCAARALGQLTNKFIGDNYDEWKAWWKTKQGE